jgi:hypothetical protein
MKKTKPTLREQVQTFHAFMHIVNMECICGGMSDHIRNIMIAMDDWSYAHRRGNGEPTEREQQQMVNVAFWKLKELVNP